MMFKINQEYITMIDKVRISRILYKWITYILMFYVGMFFFYYSNSIVKWIYSGQYGGPMAKFNFSYFDSPVVMAFYFVHFITIPMIIGVVVLIERYKFKWFKAYFIVTSVCAVVFGLTLGKIFSYDKSILIAVIPCLFTQYIVWLFFNRVFDRLDKRYNLK